MKAFLAVGLLFLGASAVLSSAPPPPIKLSPGQSYIYAYTGRLVSGIPDMDSSAAVFEIKSDIVLQAEEGSDGSRVAMQMVNIRVGQRHDAATEQLYGSIALEHQRRPEYEQELSKPIRFYWDNGQIKNFEADRTEPQWSINVKKSILALLNVNLSPKTVSSNAKSNSIHGQIDSATPVYPVYEDGMNGICETLYQVVSAHNPWMVAGHDQASSQLKVFNVTKTRNYGNCLSRSTVENSNADIRGAPVVCHEGQSHPLVGQLPGGSYRMGGCDKQSSGDQSGKQSPVSLFNHVKYNITSAGAQSRIDSIYGEGKTVYQTKGKKLVAITEQNITLAGIVSNEQLAPIEQVHNVQLHEDLTYRLPETETKLDIPYYHLYGPIDREQLKEHVPALLNSVAADIQTAEGEPNKNTMEKIVQLSNAFAVLDETTLQALFDAVAQQSDNTGATIHQSVVRKLFLDLLSTCGTTDSALMAIHLYQRDQISPAEAKEAFESIPQNLFGVNGKVVEAFLNQFLSDKVQEDRHLASSLGIALGKLINQASAKRDAAGDQDHLSAAALDGAVAVLEKALRQASKFHQKVTMIEALAHTGSPRALAILTPYVRNEASEQELPGYPSSENDSESWNEAEERDFIRQVTIYALTHLTRSNAQQVAGLVLPIYENKYEPYEVRIAAFTVLLSCNPDQAILERIASDLHSENNRQVRSFVVSTLKTVAKFNEPYAQKLAESARLALAFAPAQPLGMHYSQMIGSSYYDQDKRHGFNLMSEWVASNVSRVPRSGYFAIRESDGPSHNILLEVGYNAKGLDSFLDQLLDTESGLVVQLLGRQAELARTRRQAPLKEKLAKLAVRHEDQLKATIFLKTFERTSYYAIDTDYVQQWIESAQDSIKEAMDQLSQGRSYHYVKLALPKQFYKVVASEMGLPVVVTERNPTILSVKLNDIRLESASESGSLGMTVQIQPALYHSAYHFVFGLEPVDRNAIGVHVMKNTRLSAMLDCTFGLSPVDRQLSYSVTPKLPQEIYHHETEAKTFAMKSVIAGDPERQWLSGSMAIKTKHNPIRFEKEMLKDQLGLGLKVRAQTENARFEQEFYRSVTGNKYGPLAGLLEWWNNDKMTPCSVHLSLESDQQNPVVGYEISARYNHVDLVDDQESNQQDSSSAECANSNIFGCEQWKSVKSNSVFRIRDVRRAGSISPVVRKMIASQSSEVSESAPVSAHSVQVMAKTGGKSTSYLAEILFAHTFDRTHYFTAIRAQSKSEQETESKQLCFDSMIQYPKSPSPFYYDPISSQDLKADLKARLGYGLECRSAPFQVSVSGQLATTALFDSDSEEKSTNEWFYQQCRDDRAQGKSASYACERAIVEDAYFRQIVMDVQCEKMPASIANLTGKLALAAKVALYANLAEDASAGHDQSGLIQIQARYSDAVQEPMVDIHVQTDSQKLSFEKISAKYLPPVSSLLSTVQVYKNLWKSYQGENKCTMMEDYVRSFDNVTIPFPGKSECQYLLAADCGTAQRFAVFARQLDSDAKTKQATIMMDGAKIVLTPPGTDYASIQIDGQTEQVPVSKAKIINERGAKVYVQATASKQYPVMVVLEHPEYGLIVRYDGKNVMVVLGDQYKGETCGICGDNNGESDHEFSGPDQCLYREANDFINSYAIDQCESIATVASESRVCPAEMKKEHKFVPTTASKSLAELIGQWSYKSDQKDRRQNYHYHQHQHQQHHHHHHQYYQPSQHQHYQQQTVVWNKPVSTGSAAAAESPLQRMRTMVWPVPQQERICFSVTPILSCVEGVSRPSQVQDQTLGFHCLPSKSASAQKLAERAKYQALEVFGRKPADFVATIPAVPVSCQAV